MWLLKLSSKSQECCPAKICSCRSLPRVRHSGHSTHGSSTGQVAHRACKGQSCRVLSRGTPRWSSSKSVSSAWKCVVKRHLQVPYSSLLLRSPGLQEAGEGAASRTRLATASCRGNVLCREEKTCSSCQKGSGVLCAFAAALQCPLHVPQQECPDCGFLGLPGCFFPCTALVEVLTGAYSQCLPFPGK